MNKREKLVEPPIHIIGAGVSGLTLAYFLHQVGFKDITLFDKQRPGGMLSTKNTEYGLVESAANGILLTKTIQSLLATIGLTPIKANKASKKRYLYHHGKFSRFPLKITSIPYLIIGLVRLSFFKSLWKPKRLETVLDYTTRVFNLDIAKNLIGPGLQGIYGEDGCALSASLIFGKYTSNKKREKSIGLVSFKKGMQDFIDHLSDYLTAHKVKIKEQTIDTIDSNAVTIMATSLKSLGHVYPLAAKYFKDVRYQSISTTTIFHKKNPDLTGFGVLFNKHHNYSQLGVLFNHQIFNNRVQGDYVSETWIAATHNEDSNTVQEKLISEREKVFKNTTDSVEAVMYTTIWNNAFPRYDRELEKALDKFKQQKFDNIYFTGNYLGEIGISGIIAHNKELAYDIRNKYT